MNRKNRKLPLIYQVVLIIIIIMVLPLSFIGYYYYSSTTNGLEEVGKERGVTSLHIAQSLLNNLGENLLSITTSNSHWQDYREAIQEGNIAWIKKNVNVNLSSVPNLDFIVTTDKRGKVISSAEKEEKLIEGLDLSLIMKLLAEKNDYYGLINTSKGLSIISVSKVTDEDGNASSSSGNVIFGRLLDERTFEYMKDTLQVNMGIMNTSKLLFSSSDTITAENVQYYISKTDHSSVTLKVDGTIVIHAYESILDVANQPIGMIYIEYPLSDSTQLINNLKRMSVLDGIAITILLVILTFVLHRRVLLPLKHFTSTLEQVAAGSLVSEIPSHIVSQADDNILQLFDKLHRLSYYDYLTELPNRRFAAKHLEQFLKEAQEKNQKAAVMYLDLDRFKNVNDSLGHRTGDRLLQIVAQRLENAVSGKGMVARLGGDEFTIILPEIHDVKEVEQIAREITNSFSEQFLVDGYDLFVTSSIGISLYPSDGESSDELFMNADVAMYRAKEQGRNKYQFYSSNMNSTLYDKLKLESMLRRAIDHNELFLVYQPKVHIKTNEIVGMEALIRWMHPELGIISPNDFIPIAEETGLILSIGEWVLKTACKQNKLWQQQGMPCLKMAVNISARQFQHEDIVNTVSKVLSETGLDPNWLELEITESTAMHFADETVITLNKLNQMGVSVSIDDFGTGYSSLSYLKLFPIKSLKIDRSLIKDIEKDTGDLAIAKSVITLGHALNVEVVAEGVETHKHLEILQNEHCDFSQGFYYSPPVSAEKFEKMVKLEDKQTEFS